MEKKKVLVMNLTPRGGMLHYSSQFCNELSKKKDIQLKVGIASYHNSILYNSSIGFIKIRTNPTIYSFIIDSLNIFYHIYFIFKILKYKPDIVHFLDNHPWYIVYGRLFKSLGYEIYTTQHDPTLHSGENTSLLGTVAANVNDLLRKISDRLFVHGNELRQEVISKYGINSKKVISIKHGAYTFFSKWSQGLNVQENTFLFFGRIVDYKGLDTLLESLKLVKDKCPKFKLIIAGPGELDRYSDLLKKYSDNIEIYNFNIEPEDAYKYFEISEFVVLPYKDATGSGIIPVSYSFSKAVLVSDVGELGSVVINGQTGYIISANDSKALGQKIVEMLKEKSKIGQFGKNGKIFSDNELSWKDIIDKIYG